MFTIKNEKRHLVTFSQNVFFSFQFSGHWKEAHGDEVLPFKCDECDVRKHSKATLISHKKKWHKPRKMQKCDMCDFQVNHSVEIPEIFPHF